MYVDEVLQEAVELNELTEIEAEVISMIIRFLDRKNGENAKDFKD